MKLQCNMSVGIFTGQKDKFTTENEALKKAAQSAKAEQESLQQHNTELEMRLKVLSTQYEGKLSRLENENKELKESREKKVREEQEEKQKVLKQQEKLQR